MLAVVFFTTTALILFSVSKLSQLSLWQHLITTANSYPLEKCRSRYHIGLLYGHLHALTESRGLSVKQRHRISSQALDHALLFPASKQLSTWLNHNDSDVMLGWYVGKHLGTSRQSNWNKDDREFLGLFD